MLLFLSTGFKTALITVGDNGPTVYLDNEPTEWDWGWPDCEPPKLSCLFPIHFMRKWWAFDFYESAFCRPFSQVLTNQRAAMFMSLPHLTCLIASSLDVESCPKLLSIYRGCQLFARLSLAYASWCKSGNNNPLEAKTYIFDALRLSPTSSEQQSKVFCPVEPSCVTLNSIFTPRNAPGPKNRSFPRSFQRGRGSFRGGRGGNRGRGFTGSRSNFQNNRVTCYNCGKIGHTSRVCRTKPSKNSYPPRSTFQKKENTQQSK